MCINEINERLDLVQLFYDDSHLRMDIRDGLGQVKDLERALQRLHCQTGSPNDFLNIISTLQAVAQIKTQLMDKLKHIDNDASVLQDAIENLGSFEELISKSTLVLDYERRMDEPGFIRSGVCTHLDALRSQKDAMLSQKADMVQHLIQATGIAELSLGVDTKYGPIVDFVRLRVQSRKALETFTTQNSDLEPLARQKNATGARFTYQPWTRLSTRLSELDDRLLKAENQVFVNACEDVKACTSDILVAAQQVANLDVASALALLARDAGYVRPELTLDLDHEIKGGRHPVVEQSQLHRGQTFVKNDSRIGGDERLWLLTGANMGGKSTFLRQRWALSLLIDSAIIHILAQMGSFVPADQARLGSTRLSFVSSIVVDRIFSRVGASDDLSANQSTFMVEMSETSTILKEATPKSFVCLKMNLN